MAGTQENERQSPARARAGPPSSVLVGSFAARSGQRLELSINAVYSQAMSVPYALLGLLEQQPRHVYDLKRLFDRYFAPDHPLAFAQVYSTLGRLEQRGRVRVEAIERAEGPERRRYAITEVGTKELERWLEEPVSYTHLRAH